MGREPVWTLQREEKYIAPTRNRTLAVQPVAIPTEQPRLVISFKYGL
jgi:hypothetical protein